MGSGNTLLIHLLLPLSPANVGKFVNANIVSLVHLAPNVGHVPVTQKLIVRTHSSVEGTLAKIEKVEMIWKGFFHDYVAMKESNS